MDEPTAGAPAFLLIGSGVLTILYSLAYAVWTLSVMIWPVTVTFTSISDGTPVVDALVAFVMMMAIPLLQLVGFAITGFMGLLTMFGGVRLNRYRSKGVVWLAVLCSTGAPALALLVNAGSALNIGACGMGCITGCLLGNIPTLVVLVLGLVASIAAAMHTNTFSNRFA